MAVFARSIGYPTAGVDVPSHWPSTRSAMIECSKIERLALHSVDVFACRRRRGAEACGDCERLFPAIHPCHPHPSCFHRREPGCISGQLASRMSFLFRSVRIERLGRGGYNTTYEKQPRNNYNVVGVCSQSSNTPFPLTPICHKHQCLSHVPRPLTLDGGAPRHLRILIQLNIVTLCVELSNASFPMSRGPFGYLFLDI